MRGEPHCGDQRGVESFVQRIEFRLAFAQACAVLLGVAAQAMQGGDDRAFPGAVAALHALAQRLAFDQHAKPRDVFEIAARDLADAKSALADRDDQAARDQPRQASRTGVAPMP